MHVLSFVAVSCQILTYVTLRHTSSYVRHACGPNMVQFL